MPSYYLSEDLARFGEMAKTNPQLFDLFMKWYAATMEKGALDVKTKKLIALAVAYAIQEPYCIDSYSSACAEAGVTPGGDVGGGERGRGHPGRRRDRALGAGVQHHGPEGLIAP